MKITTQDQFDDIISKINSSDFKETTVLIFPLPNGKPYELSKTLNIKTKINIIGTDNVKIKLNSNSYINIMSSGTVYSVQIKNINFLSENAIDNILYIKDASNIIISKCIFTGANAAIKAHKVEKLYLNNCIFEKQLIRVMDLSMITLSKISKNNILDGVTGIDISISNNVIINSNVIKCKNALIQLSTCTIMSVINNIITKSSGGINCSDTTYSSISGNVIKNMNLYGIKLNASSKNIVANNLIDTVENGCGINNQGSENIISNNNIKGCSDTGIFALRRSVIINNTLKDNVNGINDPNNSTIIGNTLNKNKNNIISNSNSFTPSKLNKIL